MATPPRGSSHPGPTGAEREGGDYLDEVYPTGSEDLDRVIDAAVSMFAADGFAATRLEAISKVSGMSKRMIHYHFTDKLGLYRRALARAMESISPPVEVMGRSYAVPVEGMRRFIDAIFYRFQDNTAAVALMLRENLDNVLDPSETAALSGHSDALLHMERLLLLGQDSGAFRPGISAADVMLLVSSVCVYRIANHKASLALGQMKLTNQRNTEGLRRMTIDMVLGFLTSNIPDSGYPSYLEATSKPDAQAPKQADAYAIEAPEIY
ncbi:TetR/AcrR family transcriptional regulator [Corynebacterium liangguodongii]|uniref:TetR/AcrR family transcriptional regulator n=1 Tax=Corynebacterium liangguodongii TaxID=2079535 RepID=UPI001F42FCF0|nr:TetR/AcrR family transcriptional regulator [Corynebacterium liangguodongii]